MFYIRNKQGELIGKVGETEMLMISQQGLPTELDAEKGRLVSTDNVWLGLSDSLQIAFFKGSYIKKA